MILTLILTTRSQFDNCLPYSLCIRHGFNSELDNVDKITVYEKLIELFYLNSTLNFGLPTVLVFQLEVYYKVDRLLTGLLLNKLAQLLDGIQQNLK